MALRCRRETALRFGKLIHSRPRLERQGPPRREGAQSSSHRWFRLARTEGLSQCTGTALPLWSMLVRPLERDHISVTDGFVSTVRGPALAIQNAICTVTAHCDGEPLANRKSSRNSESWSVTSCMRTASASAPLRSSLALRLTLTTSMRSSGFQRIISGLRIRKQEIDHYESN